MNIEVTKHKDTLSVTFSEMFLHNYIPHFFHHCSINNFMLFKHTLSSINQTDFSLFDQ